MENTKNPLQEQQIVSQFTSLSLEALEGLISSLNLHMTTRDLIYCQNQYRMRERRDPTIEELHLLDTLYVTRTQRNEFQGLRTFYTSDPMIAETYADMMKKASYLRRDNRPYTPNDLSDVLTRSLVQAGKTISVPAICSGADAALRLLADGYPVSESTLLSGIPATIGYQSEKSISVSYSPQQNDQILLLLPSGLTPAAFASLVATLLPPTAQIVNIGRAGLLDALLTWDGIYLVQDYLPQAENHASLSALVSLYPHGLLIRVDGEKALALRNAASAAGLTASIIGKCTQNQHLIIRRNNQSPLQIEIPFLRAFSPILPVDAEVPEFGTPNTDISTSANLQTIIPNGDVALFSGAIPGTPFSLTDTHLLTGASSQSMTGSFRSALLTALYAVNRAVSAGVNYEMLTLSNCLATPHTDNRNLDMGQIMSVLLGVYRVQAELALPDIGGCFVDSSTNTAQVTVFAAAPKPEKIIPHHFSATGSNVYLLAPLATETSPIDFNDYRKLLHYVHDLCQTGIALSVLAVNENGIEQAVRVMTQGGYGFTAAVKLPRIPCGFLIETQQPIQGMLIGLTTALPTIRMVDTEYPVISYRPPHIPSEQIPMSEVGTSCPIICIPQTLALGHIRPIQTWLEKQCHATLQTVLLTKPTSRTQITEFANAMAFSHITVIAGNNQEISQILENRRVQYAKNNLLSRGGILLCLHTDREKTANMPIPEDHPLFFAVPASLLQDSAITFDANHSHEIHMCAASAAVAHMLACGVAYFQ